MTDKVLSVIFPILKPERYLANLKNFLHTEDLQKIEIIFVQDLRLGDTSECLIELIDSEPKLHIQLVTGSFGSAGIARNAGILAATCQWVSFCDADDYLFVRNILEDLQKNLTAQVLIGQFERIYQNGITRPSEISTKIEDLYSDPGFWRAAYKKEVINKVKFSNLRMGEDIVFFADVLRSNPRLMFSEKNYYRYSVGSLSQSTSVKDNFSDVGRAIAQIKGNNKLWRRDQNDLGFITRLAFTQAKNPQVKVKLSGILQIIEASIFSPKNFVLLLSIGRRRWLRN